MKPVPVRNLTRSYKKLKPRIRKRLSEFRAVYKTEEENIFAELCFCILTANANALMCDKAIAELKREGLLVRGAAHQIKPKLRGRVRFHNKKTEFIIRARDLLTKSGCLEVKKHLNRAEIITTRDWLVENIKGYGFKEASHFLRNIGFGQDIAILDRHILKNLKKYGVIRTIPDSVGSRTVYLAIEDRMRDFSKRIGIPMEDLDLLFWSLQTGFIFK